MATKSEASNTEQQTNSNTETVREADGNPEIKSLTLRLPYPVWEAMVKISKDLGRSFNKQATMVISEFVKENQTSD